MDNDNYMNIETKDRLIRKCLNSMANNLIILFRVFSVDNKYSITQQKYLEKYKKEKRGTTYVPKISSMEDKCRRNVKIIKMDRKGLSDREIAGMFEIGIPRVRQILRQSRKKSEEKISKGISTSQMDKNE